MKRKFPLIMGLFVISVMSAHAQENPVLPDGVVFTAPEHCLISPDDSQIAVNRVGIFSLPDGQKITDLTGKAMVYSADSRYLGVSGSGMYDAQTGRLLIESASEYPMFSPDSRLFIDYDTVYDLATLQQVAELNREGDGIESYTPAYFLNGGLWFSYQKALHAEDNASRQTFLNTTTWQPVIETQNYPAGTPIGVSADFRRYGAGGFGVFNVYTGEKLFNLPAGIPIFNDDASVIMMLPETVSPHPDNVTLVFLEGETGELLNQFDLPWAVYESIFGYRPLTNSDMSQIALPDVLDIGVDGQSNVVLKGWRVLDVRTGALIKQWLDNGIISAYEALGIPIPLAPNLIPVHGRYVMPNEGVYDAETDRLILPMTGDAFNLSKGGGYAQAQNPCTVWKLPSP